MTRRTRRAVFYIFLVFFFVIGAGVILYAQGWRVNFVNWHAQKVGAIFVRSYPSGAEIVLDGIPTQNQSGFLGSGTLISDLFPKTYSLTLNEQGYDAWHENASVLPSLVSEFKYAVLVPQSSIEVASETVQNFFVSGDENVIEDASGGIYWRSKKIAQGNIISESADFTDMITQNASSGIYSLYTFATGSSTNLSAIFTKDGLNPKTISEISIDPFNATNIIASDGQRLWTFNAGPSILLDVQKAQTGQALGPSIASSQSLLAWTEFENASNTSAVVLYDKFGNAVIGSSTVPGENLQIKWIKNNVLGVLQNNGALYLYNTDNQTFQDLANDVKDFSASTDGSILAALEQNSLEIFSFTNANTYHRFNLPSISAVEDVDWYKDDNHLFIKYPDHVAFLDLEDSGLSNLITISAGSAPFYDPQSNTLYLIDSTQNLVKFDFPQ